MGDRVALEVLLKALSCGKGPSSASIDSLEEAMGFANAADQGHVRSLSKRAGSDATPKMAGVSLTFKVCLLPLCKICMVILRPRSAAQPCFGCFESAKGAKEAIPCSHLPSSSASFPGRCLKLHVATAGHG